MYIPKGANSATPDVWGALPILLWLISCPVSAEIRFDDVSFAAGIDGGGPSYGASWGDIDGDGRPDIWVGNHPSPPILYLNMGGIFEDLALYELPAPVRDTHGAAWGDFDADGDQDLIQLVGKAGSNLLYVNEGGTLIDRAVQLNVEFHDARSRTPLWLDWNLDGLLDLVLPHAESALPFPLVLQNTGAGFEDATGAIGAEVAGLIHARLADLTGDGRLELFISRPPAIPAVYDISTTPFTNIAAALNFPTHGVRLTHGAECAVSNPMILKRKMWYPSLPHKSSLHF